MSGRTTRRNVWSRAPTIGSGKANSRFGWALGYPLGYGPWTDAAQEVTQCVAGASAAIAGVSARMIANVSAIQYRTSKLLPPQENDVHSIPSRLHRHVREALALPTQIRRPVHVLTRSSKGCSRLAALPFRDTILSKQLIDE
jgi:hypothetical protein